MPIIEISSLTHPGVDVFCMLTEAQLRQRMEPGKGVFIAESPNVISRALDAGYEPLALMCERKHISGSAAHIIKRCFDSQRGKYRWHYKAKDQSNAQKANPHHHNIA